MAIYLVTGAAGFIASKVCQQLLEAGHTVVGIDNLNDYYDVRLKDYRLARLLDRAQGTLGEDPQRSLFGAVGAGWMNSTGNFIFRRVDLERLADLEALFTEFRFDAVFNLAARAGVRASMADPFVFLSTNTAGTLNLLECQRRHGVKKQVLASTSSLYAGSPMPWDEDSPVNRPLSPYAATKKAAELLAHSYHLLYDLDITVVRYFTVFGPAGRPDMSIFRFIKWIDEGLPIELFGDGSQARDFTYIDDIAAGTILARQLLGYEIVNLGGGRSPVTLLNVIRFIEEMLGKKATIDFRPFHQADIAESWANIAKADRLLGWAPQVGLQEGVRRCVDWHVENRDWLRGIKL